MSEDRISPMRVSEMTKFVVSQASAEMNLSKKQIMEDVLCAAFPAHVKTYKILKKESK